MDLKQQYTKLVTRANKAENYFRTANEVEALKNEGEFLKILNQIVICRLELRKKGVKMTRDEVLGGWPNE